MPRLKELALVIMAGGLITPPSLADTQPRDLSLLEELVVEMAESPRQHRALARYYRGRAEEHRKLAAAHHEMAEIYGAADAKGGYKKSQHCRHLAELDEHLAKQFEELADAHEMESQR